MNPENKCADLIKEEGGEDITIEKMFELQQILQDFLADKGRAGYIRHMPFQDTIKNMIYHKQMMDNEFTELLERMPYKTWKTYTIAEKIGWTSEEQKLETWYEFIDMFHFYLNIGLLLGIDGATFKKLYYTKNKENINRQLHGY